MPFSSHHPTSPSPQHLESPSCFCGWPCARPSRAQSKAVCGIPLSSMVSWSILGVSCVCTSFLFLGQIIVHCVTAMFCLSIPPWMAFRLFPSLGDYGQAVLSIHVQFSCGCVSGSLGATPRSVVSGSWGHSVVHCSRSHQSAVHSGCTVFYSQQCVHS